MPGTILSPAWQSASAARRRTVRAASAGTTSSRGRSLRCGRSAPSRRTRASNTATCASGEPFLQRERGPEPGEPAADDRGVDVELAVERGRAVAVVGVAQPPGRLGAGKNGWCRHRDDPCTPCGTFVTFRARRLADRTCHEQPRPPALWPELAALRQNLWMLRRTLVNLGLTTGRVLRGQSVNRGLTTGRVPCGQARNGPRRSETPYERWLPSRP